MINRPLEYSLRIFGIWPDSPYPKLKIIIWIIILPTFLVFQYWYCITHIKLGLIDLLDGLSLTLSNTLVFIKLIVIWFHKRTFYEILMSMKEDLNNNYSAIENKRIITDKFILSSRISNFLISYFAITFFLYSGVALIILDEDQRKFLVRMEFPFIVTISPRYEIILITQFIFESFIVYGAATSIALIAALILYVGSQIDLFCQNLIFHSYKKRESQDIIKDIIVRHQKIIQLSKNIETIFTYIFLCQFVSNMLVICFISFVLIISLHTEQTIVLIMKCFPYYIAVNCEAFILCYTGEYITSKSENINKAIYNFLWYDLKSRDVRIILMIILRSQKQLTLTAGKFICLSLEAFANMLKASASYVSVLYARY
ncbi:odorant receptor 85b-like [Apis dorsata]|uniref:odorant receptor 85b-like n=1 Tax=Apis dorsata TaxID=7462 RepID=UPI001293C422|nr:odorant receptor 85b-like [Apis dorsata]XP_031370380.1 odorant receptor 85b-like [Apis dorsata]